MKFWRSYLAILLAIGVVTCEAAQGEAGGAQVKVAVVGGLVLSGVWPALAERAGKATGLRIETVAAAPKEGVVPVFRKGEADLLLIHGSDETYGLLAAGLAAPLRAWAMNEHVIVGPKDDPAGVAGAPGAAEALRRIVGADAPLIGFRDVGSFAIVHGLFRTLGLRPGPRQQLYDDAESPQQVLRSAADKGGYAVVGHIPVAFGKMPSEGMAVLLKGDPAMRRVYVVVEPGPLHPASPLRRKLAQRLANYLVSPRGQADLATADKEAGGPWVFPLPVRP
ncbi:tungsten ABC transporter permease [Ferribacterium limneticum]|uniref:tungsten ABC transporter permease n=1 Tax=Ferribacterium limneticum TaxID=76259 RepID=UPI001CFB6617|nr:tungsten ABC transporter permease [Ferribacterium limneticum]UCV20678.1 tungsten ABC transporter permease [Ferribacterium limneticum]